MALTQTAGLGRIADDLMGSYGASGAAELERGILKEAGPRQLSDVLGTLDAAGAQARSAVSTAEGVFGRQVRGLGQQLSERDERVANRRFGLSRALVDVGERQRTVQELRNRSDIARSAAGDLRSLLDSQAAEAVGTAAAAEANREREYQEQLAAYRRNRANTLGTIVGIGASFIPVAGPYIGQAAGQAAAGAAR